MNKERRVKLEHFKIQQFGFLYSISSQNGIFFSDVLSFPRFSHFQVNTLGSGYIFWKKITQNLPKAASLTIKKILIYVIFRYIATKIPLGNIISKEIPLTCLSNKTLNYSKQGQMNRKKSFTFGLQQNFLNFLKIAKLKTLS